MKKPRKNGKKAKNSRKKRKQNEKREKALLETSIQIEKLKYSDTRKEIVRFRNQKNRLLRSSNIVWIEYKKGLIFSLIAFYSLVELKGVSKTLLKYSDAFSGRAQKFILLLLSKISDNDDKIILTKEEFLRQIEAVIFHYLKWFFTDIERSLVGGFVKNPIAEFTITSNKDFEDFTNIVNKNRKLHLSSFFSQNTNSVDKLLASEDFKKSKKYKKHYEKLQEVKSDNTNADKKNGKLWDVAIAIDCPVNKYCIVSTDKIFPVICEALGKEIYLIPKITQSPAVQSTN